jgi:hypothetical protein
LKGIDYFGKLFGDRAKKGTVIYGGDRNRTTGHYQLLSYQKIEEPDTCPE